MQLTVSSGSEAPAALKSFR